MKNRFGLGPSHLTIIAVALIISLVPGALKAVDVFTNVAIQDPISGRKAELVGKNIRTHDSLNFWSKYPSRFLKFGSLFDVSCRLVVPSGRAKVLKTIIVSVGVNETPASDQFVGIYVGDDCSGEVVMKAWPSTTGAEDYQFEPGVAISSSSGIYVQSSSSDLLGDIYGTGYVVPNSWIPAASPAAPVAFGNGG
jgi:hypothetical protein